MVGSSGDSLSLTLQVLWLFFNLVRIYEHCISVFVYCLHSTIGTKGVAKAMKKICSGPRRDEGVTWFTELSDKGIWNTFFNEHVVKLRNFSCEGEHYFQKVSAKNKNVLVLLAAKATKTHFYWAMRNNDGTEEGFQQYLLNIVDHYQVSQVMYTNSSTPKIWFSPAIPITF